MSPNYQNSFEQLHLFLGDTIGESRESVVQNLRAAGVDVEKFVADIKQIAMGHLSASVNPGVQSGISRVSRFANITRQELLKLLETLHVSTSLERVLVTREGGYLNELSDEQLLGLLEKLEQRGEENEN